MRSIIAVDPGGTTGLAFWTEPGEYPHFEQVRRERQIRLEMLEDIRTWAAELGSDLTIVCETYTITQRTSKLSQQTDALKIIGVLEYFAHVYGPRIVMQSPADAKRFATDARLKAAGMWTPTKGGHANDANRHLFVYLVKHGLLNIGEIDARRD